MTTLGEIERAVCAALKRAYPEEKIYGADTLEGYTKPSFFVYVTQTFSEATKNALHKTVEIEIDYIQGKPDEPEAMKFFEVMERMFYHKLKTESRQLTISNLSMFFEGDNKNIPCFTFELEFWDAIEKETDDVPLMGEFNLKQEGKPWDYQ